MHMAHLGLQLDRVQGPWMQAMVFSSFALAQLVCGQVHHWLCGFVIVISSLVLMVWVCFAIGIADLVF